MPPDNLRRVAAELRSAEIDLSASTARLRRDGGSIGVETLETHCAVLRRIASAIESHAHMLVTVDAMIGDRMNNLLMSIGIASDLLAAAEVRDVRERLRAAVENGRTAVSQIRKALDGM